MAHNHEDHQHQGCCCGHHHKEAVLTKEREACGCGHDHSHGEHNHSHKAVRTIDDGLSCGCGHDHSHGEHNHSHSAGDGLSCGCGHDHSHGEHNHSHSAGDGLSCGCGSCGAEEEGHSHDHGSAAKWTIILGAIGFAAVEAYHELVGLDTYPLPLLAVLVVSYIILGGGVLLTSAKNIMKGQIFDENFLMSIATLGAFAIGEYPEAVGVMLFFRIGEYFEKIAVERSRSQIMGALDLRPETISLVQGEEIKVVPADEGRVGDIVLVRPGDRVPLDGVVVEGESRLDTSAITGEPVPVGVTMGSEVLSGCVNVNGLLKIRVTKPLSESMVTKILSSIENSAANKPQITKFITRFSRVYTPAVVAVALFTALGMPLITGQEFYPWVYTALSFLVMSCPCALVLSVPLAFYCGIGTASKQGILFKGGSAMEALSHVKAVIMDKTGTLTKGNFVVQQVACSQGFTEAEVISKAASCELNSNHPIGSSILEAAKDRGLEAQVPEGVQELAGMGVKAVFDGQSVLCGNEKLLQSEGVALPPQLPEEQGTQVLVAIDGVWAGTIYIADTIKEDAGTAIRELKAAGLKTIMLTGDNEHSAQGVAAALGIEKVYAKLVPQDKVQKLEETRRENGQVLFVGDGINDAPVLAGADVGAAMGSGADAAIEAADVVFMNSNMQAVATAVRLAKKTLGLARQNVVFAVAMKLLVIILGITGIYANMWLAVFADTGVAILCILNSIRLLYSK